VSDFVEEKSYQKYSSVVELDPEIHAALQSKADATNSSISSLANEAIRLLLQEDEEDLAAFDKRAEEPIISHEELLNDLKAHGKL